jgi:hypothetical protein
MASTYITPTALTREALRILHNKAQFIGTINKQYDPSFAKEGAKIGSDLRIRKPNKYVVNDGATLIVQDTTEEYTTLSVTTQKHIGLNFSSTDLTMTIDDFSKRYIEPAMAQMAAVIENDVYSMYKNVYNMVDNDAVALTFANILEGRKLLNENLVPMGDDRTAMLSSAHTPKLVDAVKGLFHDSSAIKQQYREGMIGRTGGFDFYENPIVAKHTTGTAAKTTGYTVNGATQSGATITIQTGTTTFLIGDVVTFAGCNAVHPETKVDLGYLQKFVVTANSGANATSLAISPTLTVSGAKQNVSGYPTNTGAVVKVGAGVSELLDTSMVYHKDAFTFATADLLMPEGVHFAARQVMDGISMRIVRQYDINNDKFPCRIDVLYGYKCLRPEMAVRIHADG